jgi:hypothetical protein
MVANPFPTRSAWQKDKKALNIPDKVIKGVSYGEKMDALNKRFAKAGLGNLSMTNLAAAVQLFDEGTTLVDAWIKGATALKPQAFGGAPKQTKAIEHVKEQKKLIDTFGREIKTTKDPFISSRKNFDKCRDAFKAMLQNPTSSNVDDLFAQGIRNWLGAPFNIARKQGYKGTPEVNKLLDDYADICDKWNGPILLEGKVKDIAEDDTLRKEFIDDMEKAMKIGARILGITKAA